MFFMPTFNFNYILYMLPAILLSLVIQLYVNASYNRWGKVQNQSGLTGAQVAQRLAERNGFYDLTFKGTPGRLTDHYDPRSNSLSLSRDVAQRPTIAAMAITAHEMGHAQQDKDDYLLMRIRSAMVPAANIGTSVGWIFILVGLLLEVSGLAWVGVFAFSAGAIFAIATLPVEMNLPRLPTVSANR